MYDNYNYPPGADTPDAPWNQYVPEEKELDTAVTITLSKKVTLFVDDYTVTKEFDADIDDEGHSYYREWEDIDFSSCDLEAAFDSQCNDISTLLEEFIVLATDKVTQLKRELKMFKMNNRLKSQLTKRIIELSGMIEDASEWTQEEVDISRE